MADAWSSLDAEVRRVDEDRWLASRFAAREARRRLVAIYAVSHEIARTAEVVSDPGIGAIRLAWWRDAISETSSGKPPAQHGALQALAAAGGAQPTQLPIWQAMIEARVADFEASPFAALEDIERYVDATAGGVIRLALLACGADAEMTERVASRAGQAWGVTGLMRAEPYWRARGRRLLAAEGCSHAAMIARARAAHAETRRSAASLPAEAFAAIGYVALVPAYLDALEAGREGPALFMRQVRLVLASASGRV